MTKKQSLLNLLRRRWVSTSDSTRICGINSLAQRVSEWRRAGIAIHDKWVSHGGSRFKAYTARGGK